jgi:hypothetical protein
MRSLSVLQSIVPSSRGIGRVLLLALSVMAALAGALALICLLSVLPVLGGVILIGLAVLALSGSPLAGRGTADAVAGGPTALAFWHDRSSGTDAVGAGTTAFA